MPLEMISLKLSFIVTRTSSMHCYRDKNNIDSHSETESHK